MYLLARNSHILLPVSYQQSTCDFVDFVVNNHFEVIHRSEEMLFFLELLFHTVTEATLHSDLDSIRKPVLYYVWLSRRVASSRKVDQYRKHLYADAPLVNKVRSISFKKKLLVIFNF